ncbi:MAG: hypothetical protein HRU46_11840, partial [Verrucomicrobiales bacterium]|nr:hypothetical protein [Verrucomicrobiales bacterium]
MNTLLKRLLPVLALAAMTVPAKAQIGDNEPSQSLLAVQCAMSSGYPAAGYEEYCRRLAKTVAFLSPVQQERVFGYVPQPYNGNDQDAYVTPHYGQGGVTNYERNNGATGGVVFHGTGGSSEPVSASVTPGGGTSGAVTSGGATSGGVTSGGVTSGGVTSGGVTSGGVTSGGVTSGGV